MAVRKSKDKSVPLPNEKGWINVYRLAAGIILALIVGAIAGCGRYWYGYFVLGQGTIVGLFIPWAANILCSNEIPASKMMKNPGSIIQVLILFFSFMIAQANRTSYLLPTLKHTIRCIML